MAYTIKPILYSALAGLLLRLTSSLGSRGLHNFRLIAFFTGIGRAFISRRLFHRALSSAVCLFLRDASQLWVLNEHNRDLLRRRLPQRADRVLLSFDMGIDFSRFHDALSASKHVQGLVQGHVHGQGRERGTRQLDARQPTAIRFLYLSRLLRAKGVGEYLEAARIISNRAAPARAAPALEFLLAGDYADGDPDSFPLELIEQAHERGDITWLDKGVGVRREDVATLLETADCLVLPSYYAEGLPRIILEAAAMEVPAIVARYCGWQRVVAPPALSNEPRCSNALTCACRDSEDLARTMLSFSSLPQGERRSMGLVARGYVESHFSQELACDFYLSSLSRAAHGD